LIAFPSFANVSPFLRRTDFGPILVDFDSFQRPWYDGVVLLVKNVVQKTLDWTDWGSDRTDRGTTVRQSTTKAIGWNDELTRPTEIGTTNSKIRSTAR
jgi:hypothetical protein